MLAVDIILTILILLCLVFFLYEKLLVNFIHGKTRLRIALKRKNKLDCLIFVSLTGILIYANISSKALVLTDWLLLGLALMSICFFCIRSPELCFKDTGFFYVGIFIRYNQITSINLSEDGILVITLEKRRLLIHVSRLDSLEKIYHFLLEN